MGPVELVQKRALDRDILEMRNWMSRFASRKFNGCLHPPHRRVIGPDAFPRYVGWAIDFDLRVV